MLYQTEKRNVMRKQAYNNFYRKFSSLEKFRKTALLASELIRSAGSFVLLLAFYIVADYFLAFPNEALLFLDCLFGLFIIVAFGTRALKIVLLSRADSAAFLDTVAKNKRRSILLRT